MEPSHRVHKALAILLQAHTYTEELACNAWDFAVEIKSLSEAGLSNSDLRWLLHRNLVVQAPEVTDQDDGQRRFGPRGGLLLSDQSCFVLTPAGILLARGSNVPLPQSSGDPAGEPVVPAGICPSWDKDRRSLWFGRELIKQFKVPAPNQEIILASFEEESWPVRIDDPLSPHSAIDPKRRLHDTINSLNRNQRVKLLRFLGDGSGQAVCWEPAGAASELGSGRRPGEFVGRNGEPAA